MNPAQLTAAITSIAIAVAGMVAAIGDTSLASGIRATMAAASPLVVIVLTYVLHQTEQAKIQASAAVAVAKTSSPDPGAVAGAVMSHLGAAMGTPPAK